MYSSVRVLKIVIASVSERELMASYIRIGRRIRQNYDFLNSGREAKSNPVFTYSYSWPLLSDYAGDG